MEIQGDIVFNPEDSLRDAIEKHSYLLNVPIGIDPKALLWAIAGNETQFGHFRNYVRAEEAFLPGGRFYKASNELREKYREYGVLASSSIGTWQIMYITAYELGYKLHPIFLQTNYIAIQCVIEFINRRAFGRGAINIAEVFDAYNSGSFKDKFMPSSYILKGKNYYGEYLSDKGV